MCFIPTLVVAAVFVIGGLFCIRGADIWLAALCLTTGALFIITAYIVKRFGDDYGLAAFQASLGVAFLGQGIFKFFLTRKSKKIGT